MATNTSRLGLLKKDTATDGNDTFNIKTMLNDNWDLIDAKVATLGADGKVPADQLSITTPADASTTQKGVVMLEDSVSSTSVTKAATPKSVKTVNDALDAHKTDDTIHVKKDGTLQSGLNAQKINGKTASATPSTTEKTDIIGMVNELFTSVSSGKTQVANAITAKGQPASGSDTFAQLATKISNISTGPEFTLVAGTGITYSDTTLSTSTALDYSKIREAKILKSGSVRVSFNIRNTSASYANISARVYINGIAKGIERSTNSTSNTTFSEDFTVKENDAIQIYMKTDNNTRAGEVSNFTLGIATPTLATKVM